MHPYPCLSPQVLDSRLLGSSTSLLQELLFSAMIESNQEPSPFHFIRSVPISFDAWFPANLIYPSLVRLGWRSSVREINPLRRWVQLISSNCTGGVQLNRVNLGLGIVRALARGGDGEGGTKSPVWYRHSLVCYCGGYDWCEWGRLECSVFWMNWSSYIIFQWQQCNCNSLFSLHFSAFVCPFSSVWVGVPPVHIFFLSWSLTSSASLLATNWVTVYFRQCTLSTCMLCSLASELCVNCCSYEPGPAFEEVKEEAMLDISPTESTEFWLIQWPKDQVTLIFCILVVFL
jgi:hypothetical protein